MLLLWTSPGRGRGALTKVSWQRTSQQCWCSLLRTLRRWHLDLSFCLGPIRLFCPKFIDLKRALTLRNCFQVAAQRTDVPFSFASIDFISFISGAITVKIFTHTFELKFWVNFHQILSCLFGARVWAFYRSNYFIDVLGLLSLVGTSCLSTRSMTLYSLSCYQFFAINQAFRTKTDAR